MIDLYYWPTPNGHKITLFLEEAGVDYTIKPVNISAGDQFNPEFLAFSPNNRMPAIIDHSPVDHGQPVTVFESGAILLYLAEKTGLFLPTDLRGRKTTTEWLFWQMGGLGPMAGQNHHFGVYAPERIPYAINRYVNETNRLLESSIVVSPTARFWLATPTPSQTWRPIRGSFPGNDSGRTWTTS
jgi:GST-like protein